MLKLLAKIIETDKSAGTGNEAADGDRLIKADVAVSSAPTVVWPQVF